MPREQSSISPWWLQGAILTYIVGFTVLGVLAYLTYSEQPPIPGQVAGTSGATVFTRQDVQQGMNVFQRYGVMEYGTVYGHGAYLGPDYTAEYLHRSAEFLLRSYRQRPQGAAGAVELVTAELHRNDYDAAADRLVWSDARVAAHQDLVEYYQRIFRNKVSAGGAQAEWITDPEDVRKMTAFFAWTAWTSTATRPGKSYSYTNNWPPEPLAGNYVTAEAVTWSVISIIGLLGGAGVILFLFGRHDWLGWGQAGHTVRLRPVDQVGLTGSQKVVVWFLVVSSALFVLQTFVGGLAAHYRAEPGNFFGVDVSQYMPYNAARTWHVQLAIFWVSASFVATGIFILPFIAGREPRGQRTLTIALLLAVAVVVFGSLAGEYAGIRGWLAGASTWFWFGHQGWEYIDLGRLWQILLVVGLGLWVFIVWRGLRRSLRSSPRAGLPWLLFYSALTIPLFYAVGLLANPDKAFVISDFWRFWVVHLWVEDFLELFTTVVVAYMFVLLGVVAVDVATRIIYLDIILYSIGGVIGTMHHLYFSGTPAAHLALGATFSAMEVIPLLLLSLEAWGFIRSGQLSTIGPEPYLHKWAVWFLVAVGLWNFFGAGVFGFLINLPVVSYYEIGTNLTANHGHLAMMGVYGMLAIGLLLFCLRYIMRPDKWSDRAAKISFWSLNIGLTWMAFANLFPVGIVQLFDAVQTGYWHARSLNFLEIPWVHSLEWARFPGDVLFIVGGAVPVLWLSIRAVLHPNRALTQEDAAEPAPLYVQETPR